MLTNFKRTFLTIFSLFSLSLISSCDKNTNSITDKAQSQKETSESTSLNYTKIKPSTVNFPELKIDNTAFPVAKSDAIDWSKATPKTQIAKNILSALQNKDDIKLGELTKDSGILGLDRFEGGNSYDPAPEESALIDDFREIFKAQPGIALELAKYSERTNDVITTSTRYESAIEYGSTVAIAEYEKHGRNSPEAAFHVATYYENLNPLKAIEFASLSTKLVDKNLKSNALRTLSNIVWKNGPYVAAVAWKFPLENAGINQNVDAQDSVKECKELGADFIDPTRRGPFVGKIKSEVVKVCLRALATNPDDNALWYNYALAVQEEGKFLEAQIGYARAAQLGHPIAIARYWWNDYAYNPERAIQYLSAESKQGNPYGDFLLAQIFDGNSYSKAIDLKKAEKLYIQAYEKGIIAASYELGAFYHKNKDFSSAFNWYQKASTYYPEAFLKLGSMYELGEGVKQDYDQALKLYETASSQGAESVGYYIVRMDETKKKLALTGRADGHYAVKNSIFCESLNAFIKVDVIERTGNENYIDLPYNCVYANKDLKVNIIDYVSTNMGSFAVVKNTQDNMTLYVRKRDIR